KDTTFTPKTTDADITITVADDDVVNKAEADKATVPVAVKVAPKDGETVTDVKVIINNKEHTATKQANGDYVAQVKPADIKADQDKHADAKVTLTKAGKTGTVTDKEAYTVDTDAPAVTATRQPDNSVTGKTEPNTEIVDKAGNPITGANGKPIVSDAAGNFTIPANKVPTDNIIGAKDKAGNVGTGNVTPADTTPPKVKGNPTVDEAGNTLTVTFDEPLDAKNPPAKEDFTVKVGGKAVTPTAVTVEGDKVKLTLPEPAKKGDTVTVSYKDPSANNDPKAVQDKAGNDAA
ncbi:SwmB domain-containing protein, partial [Moraxella catarrhalis]|uniref:SwmB domain-containing protein n=2 Tax=Moraxella catarrhalis TaxID=480 RepID=UPI0022284B1F